MLQVPVQVVLQDCDLEVADRLREILHVGDRVSDAEGLLLWLLVGEQEPTTDPVDDRVRLFEDDSLILVDGVPESLGDAEDDPEGVPERSDHEALVVCVRVIDQLPLRLDEHDRDWREVTLGVHDEDHEPDLLGDTDPDLLRRSVAVAEGDDDAVTL